MICIDNAFAEFQKIEVDSNSDRIRAMSESCEVLFERLAYISKKDKWFPEIGREYVLYGSLARNTVIRSTIDVDIAILINGADIQPVEYFNRKGHYYATLGSQNGRLAKFRDDFGNVSSLRMLRSMRRSMENGLAELNAKVRRDNEALVVSIRSFEWPFNVLPVISMKKIRRDNNRHLIPNGRGNWMLTDLHADLRNVQKVVARYGSIALEVVRLLKYWNSHSNKRRFASYHFETIALRTFALIKRLQSHRISVKEFFENCQEYIISPCPDPRGIGPDLDAQINIEVQERVLAAVQFAHDVSSLALHAESTGDYERAIRLWKKVFGRNFYKYGERLLP